MDGRTLDFNNQRILKIAVPIIISNSTIPLLGLVDTIIIGQLGQAKFIAAVGLGSIIISSLYWMFGFLRMGTTGLVSQAVSSRDPLEGYYILFRGLIIGIISGLFIWLLGIPILWGILLLSPSEKMVELMAFDYAKIRLISAPFAIAIIPITGWLIATESTYKILAMQIITNLLNLVLNFWFVIYLKLGVKGVALSTVIAELVCLLLGLYFCRAIFGKLINSNPAVLFKLSHWKKLLIINTDIFVRSLILQFSIFGAIFFSGIYGVTILAANQLLIQFLYIASYTLDGFAFAAEVLIGLAVGAKDPKAFRVASVLCARWGFFGALALSIIFWIFGHYFISFMTTATIVQNTAIEYLNWLIVSPILAFGAYILDGIFFGATATKYMRVAMLQSFLLFLITIIILLPLYQNHSIWIAINLLFIFRAATLLRFYPLIESTTV